MSLDDAEHPLLGHHLLAYYSRCRLALLGRHVGNTLILSASVQSMFGAGPLNSAQHLVALGPRIGIRDMARVTGGILILAGPIADQVGPATVFRWNEVTNELRDLGLLAEPSNRKAESLIVLDEDPEFYTILVMYDDIANGGPTQYNIPL